MFSSIYRFFSHTFFAIDITCLFLYEYTNYALNKNYEAFIYNISRKLASKNILYVKLFQAISLNNKMIDESINNELLKFTDCVPYTEEDTNNELLSQLMKRYKLRSAGSTKPINSGMISLVYKCLQENGVPIIIKMKRKNIDNRLHNAIDCLQFFIHLISFVPYFNTMNIGSTIQKNIVLLKEQLDFSKEVKNTMKMKELCQAIPYIKIPKVYEEVTNYYPEVIIMEYIHGNHISTIDEADYEAYAKLVLKYGFVSLINHGVTHGDLHSGNILFIKNDANDTNEQSAVPNYQIGLIDFGIIIHIHKEMTELLLDLATTMFSEPGRVTGKKIVQIIINNFDIIPYVHKENIYNEVGIIVEKVLYLSKEANQLKLYEFFHTLNTYLNKNHFKKYNITVKDDFIKLQMGLAMSHGISMHLCKEDYIIFANKVLNELFHIDLLFMDR
jgi:predicted unusual protein kinase regulating ubiquinone biosynthesis (AarF/ABC1/UbiB family)